MFFFLKKKKKEKEGCADIDAPLFGETKSGKAPRETRETSPGQQKPVRKNE